MIVLAKSNKTRHLKDRISPLVYHRLYPACWSDSAHGSFPWLQEPGPPWILYPGEWKMSHLEGHCFLGKNREWWIRTANQHIELHWSRLSVTITYTCVGQYICQDGSSGLKVGLWLGFGLSMGEGGRSRRGGGGALDGTVDPVIWALQALS